MLRPAYGENLEILLHNDHGDRTPQLHSERNDRASVEVIFDRDEIENLLNSSPGENESMVDDFVEKFHPDLIDAAGAPEHVRFIYRAYGTLEQQTTSFNLYLEELFESRPSGDDDYYDYWPGGLRTAVQWAKDLDKASKSDTYTSAIQSRYKDFVDRFGEMEEFTLQDVGL